MVYVLNIDLIPKNENKILSFKWEFVLTEFHCNIFRNQFGGVFVGFFNAKSSRLDTGLVLTSLLSWASGESETKGKGGLESWSNLMI